jgi:hypothetical protein
MAPPSPASLLEDTISTLEALHLGVASPRERRLRNDEAERLEVHQVRPLVDVGQETVRVLLGPERHPLTLTLTWLERWGGTFGPRSSAAANRGRGRTSEQRLDGPALEPEGTSDRGSRPAWLLYLKCPQCSRRCRVLNSPRGQHAYGCPKCVPLAYPCSRRSGSGTRRNPGAVAERKRMKHQEAADRILATYLGHTGSRRGLITPARWAIDKPPRMTWLRFEALCRLVEAHETLATMAQLHVMELTLSRLTGGEVPAIPPDQKATRRMELWAGLVLRHDAWALRQRSWHRRGLPRDTPGQGTRERLARLETSAEGSGRA